MSGNCPENPARLSDWDKRRWSFNGPLQVRHEGGETASFAFNPGTMRHGTHQRDAFEYLTLSGKHGAHALEADQALAVLLAGLHLAGAGAEVLAHYHLAHRSRPFFQSAEEYVLFAEPRLATRLAISIGADQAAVSGSSRIEYSEGRVAGVEAPQKPLQ
jgi:hypothetical protein